MDFPYAAMENRYFFDGNILKSAYIAALSATFPAGEGEFIASVRLFQDQIEDPELKQQVRGFIGQEAHHSLQHKQFNIALQKLGFDAVRLEGVFEKDLAADLVGKTAEERLAYTVCFEHQTAILSNEFLSNDRPLSGMDPTIRDLILWHSVEEVEHKGVAFDIFMLCVGDRDLLKRVQKDATRKFMRRVSKYIFLLLWWAKAMPSWRDVSAYTRFMVGEGGLLRNLKQPYDDFFRDDFHPWQHDNSDLIAQWKAGSYKPEQDRNSADYQNPNLMAAAS